VAFAYAPLVAGGPNWGIQMFVDGVPEIGYEAPVPATLPPRQITVDALFRIPSAASGGYGSSYKGFADEIRFEPLNVLDASFIPLLKKDYGSWQPPRPFMVYLEFSRWMKYQNSTSNVPQALMSDIHNPSITFKTSQSAITSAPGASRKNDNTIDQTNEGYGLRLFTGSKCFARTKDSLIGLTGKLGDVKVGALPVTLWSQINAAAVDDSTGVFSSAPLALDALKGTVTLTVSASNFTKLNLAVGDKIVLANADRQSQNVVSALTSPTITLNFPLDFDYLVAKNSLILGKRISEGCAAIPFSGNFGVDNSIAELMRLWN